MRWATHLGLFTLAVLLPVHAGAQGNGTFAEAKSAGPVERILMHVHGTLRQAVVCGKFHIPAELPMSNLFEPIHLARAGVRCLAGLFQRARWASIADFVFDRLFGECLL